MSSFFSLLPNYQLIALTGDKAAAFLQGQITCDVRDVNSTQTRRGAHCTPKGRVLFTFRVLEFQTRLYLLIPAVMVETAITQLKKYAAFSKVTLHHDDTLEIMGCKGIHLSDTLTTYFGALPTHTDGAIYHNDCLIIRSQNEQLEPRFEIVGTSKTIFTLQEILKEENTQRTHTQWQLSEINAGIPTIYPQTSDLFTPQMLNYPAIGGVSFKKGCYTGQEVIARTHYLGKAKRHLHRFCLESETLPLPLDPLHNAKQTVIGTVVDAAFEKTGVCQGLAVLQDDALQETLYWQLQVITTPILP